MSPIALLLSTTTAIPVALGTCAEGEDCTLTPAVFNVIVTDATTGARICDASVTVKDLHNSSASPSGNFFSLGVLGSASECIYVGSLVPDAFEVTVTKDGYAPSTVDGTKHVVTINGCSQAGSDAGAGIEDLRFMLTRA